MFSRRDLFKFMGVGVLIPTGKLVGLEDDDLDDEYPLGLGEIEDTPAHAGHKNSLYDCFKEDVFAGKAADITSVSLRIVGPGYVFDRTHRGISQITDKIYQQRRIPVSWDETVLQNTGGWPLFISGMAASEAAGCVAYRPNGRLISHCQFADKYHLSHRDTLTLAVKTVVSLIT